MRITYPHVKELCVRIDRKNRIDLITLSGRYTYNYCVYIAIHDKVKILSSTSEVLSLALRQ